MKPKNCNFFSILLSAILHVELHCSSIVKKNIYIYIYILSLILSPLSLISLVISVLFSLFLLCFSIYSLISKASLPSLGFWILEVRLAWIGKLGLDRWVGIGWWWVWTGWLVGLKWWICWLMGESVGLIIGSSDGGFGDDFFWMGLVRWLRWWFFLNGFAPVMIFLISGLSFKFAAWVSDRWLGWWVWWPLLAPTGLMVCVLCVCGFVVVGLWLKWLVILGFRWAFFFFSFCCDAGFFFFFLIWVFVPLGFWWVVGSGGLGFSGFLFWWVCVCHTGLEGEREEGILCWTGAEREREEKKDCWKA